MNNAIVLMFDDDYFKYGKVCISSIKKNYPGHPVILAFYDGCDKNKIAFLNSIDNLKIMPYESDYSRSIGLKMEGLNLGVINNPKVFFKYLLWTQVFDEYDHVLHLDADTMVLKPLDYLFTQPDFFAVSNAYDTLFYEEMAADVSLREALKKGGISYDNGKIEMLNAGVFVIPKKYRTKEQLALLLGLTERYNKYIKYGDQSGISLWCHYNKIRINEMYEYNFQGFFYTTTTFWDFNYSNIHVLHFAGAWKPDGEVYNSVFSIAKHFLNVHDKFNVYLTE